MVSRAKRFYTSQAQDLVGIASQLERSEVVQTAKYLISEMDRIEMNPGNLGYRILLDLLEEGAKEPLQLIEPQYKDSSPSRFAC